MADCRGVPESNKATDCIPSSRHIIMTLKSAILWGQMLAAGLFATFAVAREISEVPGIDSFSSDYQNPTLFELELGSNLISGEVGAAGSGTLLQDGTDGGTDGDYFTVVVPVGFVLEQLNVNRYNQFQRGFAAYAPGTQLGDPTDIGGGNTFYPIADGALFFGDNDFGDLPPQALFIGSDAPLDPSDSGFNVDVWWPGAYALLIQENQFLRTEYILEFIVRADGDFNRDGVVDVVDWNFFKNQFGTNIGGLNAAQQYFAGDLNRNGAIDLGDAQLFAASFDNFHGVGAFAAAVGIPEPVSMAIACIALACLPRATTRGRRSLDKSSVSSDQ
jgi:hypothetical protein